MKGKLVTLVLLSFVFSTFAQNSYCNTAISVCGEFYQENNSPSGTGNVFEMSPGSCQTSGEFNSAWYVFTVQENGVLNFILDPNSQQDDYDWSLYNISDNGCEGINNGQSPEVSCNSYGETFGTQGPTGISSANGGSGSSNGPGNTFGPPFNGDLNVTAGEVYALVVMNYSSTLNGYSLDFGTSTASIYDEIPPTITSIDPTCDQENVIVHLSENVPSDLLIASNISLVTAGNTYNPISVTTSSSNVNTFTLNLGAGFDYSGPITLTFDEPVTDFCGNELSLQYTFSLDGPLDAVLTTHPACNGVGGSLDIVPSGMGTACYEYVINGTAYNVGDCDATTITNLDDGDYVLTLSNDSSVCVMTFDFTIENLVSNLELGLDQVLCDMNYVTDVTLTGNNFQWDAVPGLSFGSMSDPTTVVTADQPGQYTLSATVVENGCEGSDQVEITFNYPPQVSLTATDATCFGACDGTLLVSDIENPNLNVTFAGQTLSGNNLLFEGVCSGEYNATIIFSSACTAIYDVLIQSPPEVVAHFDADPWLTTLDATVINLENTSENATSIEWTLADTSVVVSTEDAWSLTLPAEIGFHIITISAQDEFGCKDEFSGYVEIRDNFYIYIPNTFTPNDDGMNDVFLPQFSYKPEFYYIEIYNRWGQLIFESTDSSQAWTGGYLNGNYFVEDGEYDWVLKVKGLEVDTRTLKGNVLIIR
jgi:gliding motility-associated-like protein